MRFTRLSLAFLILGAASLIGIRMERRRHQLLRSNATIAAQIQQEEKDAAETKAQSLLLEKELQQVHAVVAADLAQRRRLEAEFLAAEDNRWSSPPLNLPDWNPDSPYVWIDKAVLQDFPIEPFQRDGSIDAKLARALDIEPTRLEALNATLSHSMKEYRRAEAEHAVPSADHLPGIRDMDGEKVTLRIAPSAEWGSGLRARFEDAITESLGTDRAALILKTGESWLNAQLGGTGTEPTIYSVVRRTSGDYSVAIQSSASWISVSGGDSFERQVPSHLKPLFQFDANANAGANAPAPTRQP